MGGGKDQKQANNQLAAQSSYQAGQQKQFDTRNTADLDQSRGRADEMYNSLKAGYGSLINPTTGAPMGGAGGGGGGGGYQAPALDPRFKDVEAQYKNFMDTGGWEPDVRKAQQGRIDTLTEFGKTGGISAEDQARARGGGNYEEFAKTGGFSDKDIGNIRSRGTSGIPAMYQQMQQEMQRGNKIAGGGGPGAGILAGRMARQQASGIADASLNTELGIKDQVNKGRQWGTAGMSSSELALQDLLSKNKLAGTGAANQSQESMMQSIMGGRQWGTQGEHGLVSEQQQRADQQAAAAAAASAGAAGRASADEKWNAEFGLKQKLAGLEGMGGLYTSSPEEYMANKQFALDSSQTYGNQVGGASTAQKTGNVSAWDRVGQIGGMAAGGITGVAGFGAKPPVNNWQKYNNPG